MDFVMIWKKSEEKSVQLVRGSFVICNFLQDPYFSGFRRFYHLSFINLYHIIPGHISRHSVVDAPTNSKFLGFSQLHPYFHLVKSFFTFFCPKKEQWSFFFSFFRTNMDIFCLKAGLICTKLLVADSYRLYH